MQKMKPETEDLLNKLFTTQETSILRNNIHFNEYLSKIGSRKCEELYREQNKLKEEETSILEQTQELAVTNYKTFIQTAECSRDLFDSFNNISEKLEDLLGNVPTFEKKCQTFAANTSGINSLRRLNSLTLTRSAQLLEVLELPQLMDSFIKDSLYEDAFELASYVRRLYNNYPDIPVFESIVEEINKTWLIMLHHLLVQLRQDIQLSRCLQIVSYLRRMEVFTEAELRLKFLHARKVWLQQSLNAIHDTSANNHLNKIIEVTRVNLFSIITQYKAIFNDDEHGSLGSFKNQNVNQSVIFFSWIRDQILEFLFTLENWLTTDVTSIESVLGQCMYFGLSFSRVGCDFRSAMVPIFNKAIANRFESAILKATRNFEKNIERFTLINKNHSNVPWKNKSNEPLQPPETLLEFYPLAEYLNQILTAFNELRLCPPIAIIKEVVTFLEQSLVIISKEILVLYGQEQQAFTPNSKEAFVRLCLCFVDDLVPYLQKCINLIYPPNFISSLVNCSVNNLQKESIILIDKNMIIEPIKHLLPVKIEPDIKTETTLDIKNNVEVSNENNIFENENTKNGDIDSTINQS